MKTRTLALLTGSALVATATAAIARLDPRQPAPGSEHQSPAAGASTSRAGEAWVIDRSRSSSDATAAVFDAACARAKTIVELAATPHVRAQDAPCVDGPLPTTPGTDLLAALEAAYATSPREVVVVSDGLDTRWGADVDARAAAIVDAVDKARRSGTRTTFFGVGAAIDVERLETLARAGGGAPLGDTTTLARLLSARDPSEDPR
jgi:hypothetical protein